MDVTLDGKPIDLAIAPGPTVKDFLRHLRAADEDRLVVEIHVDGLEIEQSEMAATLARPLDTEGKLELFTESVRMLAAAALGQAVEVLEGTRECHVPIAAHLAAGRHAEAMDLLGKCLAAWEATDRTLRQACQTAGMDLAADGSPPSPAAMMAELRTALERIQRAMKSRDYVQVADIMEHELPGLTERWQEMLVGLQQRILDRQ